MQHTFEMSNQDFKGDHLCEPCWNGNHFSYTIDRKKKIGAKFSKCKGGTCDCQCRAMLQEPIRRTKKDRSLQMEIDTKLNVISVGSGDTHKDIG